MKITKEWLYECIAGYMGNPLVAADECWKAVQLDRENERKEMLESLLPPIRDIDGGCSYCIRAFADQANRILEPKGLSLVRPEGGFWDDCIVGTPE